MNAPATKLENRLRFAGVLVILGLLVELISLHWAHPTAFLLFIFLGGTLIFLGIVLYLFSLVKSGEVHL